MVSQDSPELVGKTLRTLRTTGDAGKKLLADTVGDREDLARWFVDLKDRQAFQRRLAEAYQRGDVSLQEIDQLQRRYDALDPARREEVRAFTDTTGGAGVRFVGRTDQDTVDTLFDPACQAVSLGFAVSGGVGGAFGAPVGLTAVQSGPSDCAHWDLVVSGVRRSDSDLASVAPKFDALSRRDQVDSVAVRIGQRPAVAESMDALTGRQLDELAEAADGGQVADALDLHASGLRHADVLEFAQADDLRVTEMSRALRIYDSNDVDISKQHSLGEAQGQLAESVARPSVRSEYPSQQGYQIVNQVDLERRSDGSDAGEFDYVVIDEDGTVVEVYEVKSAVDDAGDARSQLRDAMDGIERGDTRIDHGGLTEEQFISNIDQIRSTTVGPADGIDYDLTVDVTRDEIDRLAAAIQDRVTN